MALLRELDPGEMGVAERVKPAERHPPVTVVFENGGVWRERVPIPGVAKLLGDGDRFFFGNFQAPTPEELEGLRREFGFHPLAIEDVLTRHQRPKIDIYSDHYFLVFYRIGAGNGSSDDVLIQEVDCFIGQNFLVVTHDSRIPLLDDQFQRFCRTPGPKSVSVLLYELLDALVDEYFPFLDDVAERSAEIEDALFKKFEAKHLERMLELKRDLIRLRRVVSPERDVVNVLLRRDPPVIDPAQIVYFQDVYDHLVRVTESIDTYRELVTGSLEAFLSVQNNRLSEVVRKLTVISVTFLPLTFITGFFGMNFRVFDPSNDVLFIVSLLLMAAVPTALLLYLKRKGLE
ncbi:MAG: magnesium transporter CorA family protein [Thermoanaerobaculia bacterium]